MSRLNSSVSWCVAGAAAALLAAVAFAGASINQSSGTIGTIFSIASFGFSPTKAPKVQLVPQAGQAFSKPVSMKVTAFSDIRIDAQVLKGLAGVYDVKITPSGGLPVIADTSFTIVLPAPASIDPATGPVKVAARIHGASFGTAKGKVTIGGKPAKVTTWADDYIDVVVPKKLAAGAQPVVVIGKAGTSLMGPTYTVTADTSSGGEFMRLDVGSLHLEQTKRAQFFFNATYNVSQNFVGVGVSQPPNANPSFGLNINLPNLATPTPFVVTTSPTATGTLTATFSDGKGSVYQANLGSDFTLNVTSYSGGVLAGTFGGTMTKLAGSGAATVTVTGGAFSAHLDVVGQ
jgi:hypothetical protein